MDERKYYIELYYGYQKGESGVWHAFDAVDPFGQHDDDALAAKLSAALDTTPDDDSFDYNSMQILLPAEVVKRIKADAIAEFLRFAAEGKDETKQECVQ